jgi:dTDP-4-amino-4,6-dideoxygalactose transaminase
MVTCNDENLAEWLRVLRVHGSKPKYYHQLVGGNFRLDALQAAVLLVKLKYLDAWTEQRRENAAYYNSLFQQAGLVEKGTVIPPRALWEDSLTARISNPNPAIRNPQSETGNPPEGWESEGQIRNLKSTSHVFPHIYNQYVVRAQERDELRAYLGEKGIGTEIYYPLALHRQECFADLGYLQNDFPESERAAAETLALPIYPELTHTQLDYVIEKINSFYMGKP